MSCSQCSQRGKVLKPLLILLLFCGPKHGALGQGTVAFANTLKTFVSTNATGVGGTSGPTSSAVGAFEYGLFVAPSTETGATLTGVLSGSWVFTGVYATNVALVSGGRFNGGAMVPVATWQTDETKSFVIVGWSTGLGTTWSSVAARMAGSAFVGSVWSGPELPSGQFFGLSNVGQGRPGGGWPPLPPLLLFAADPNSRGTPITEGFELYATASLVSSVPEPSSLALILVGFATFSGVGKRRSIRPQCSKASRRLIGAEKTPK